MLSNPSTAWTNRSYIINVENAGRLVREEVL